ncbi:MAG: hypothetical protein AB7G75_29945 [Candidatus Binatia bacterium]
MKHQQNFLQTLKQHGKQIITTTLLTGALWQPWKAAEAEPLVFANLNPHEYNDLAGEASSKGCSNDGAQLTSRLPRYDFQTNALAPTFLHNHTPAHLNEDKPRTVIDDDGFVVVFSW